MFAQLMKMEFCSKVATQTLLDTFKRNSKNNIMVSPLSFNAILNMIAAGSSGSMAKQMLNLLGSTNIKDLNSQFEEFMTIATSKNKKKNCVEDPNAKKGPLLSFVNGVWVNKQYKFAESYKKTVKTVYKAEARNLDFSKAKEAVKEVNAWAKSASNGLIKDLLKPSDITEDTDLILGNALYFKGSWVKPFECKRTKEKEFYLLNGDKIKVPFMTGCTKYTYGSFTDFQVVQIPYEMGDDTKRQVSMYIFLPNKKDGLRRLLKKANSDSEFLKIYSKLRYRRINEFWIPKFKFSYSNEEVLKTMQKLGLPNLLEVTEMVDYEFPFFVTNIFQKAFIEIDEKGTEAVAVTVTRGAAGCAAPRKQEVITFVADHPFMFTIMEENSGLVFFTGAVLNPLLK